MEEVENEQMMTTSNRSQSSPDIQKINKSGFNQQIEISNNNKLIIPSNIS